MEKQVIEITPLSAMVINGFINSALKVFDKSDPLMTSLHSAHKELKDKLLELPTEKLDDTILLMRAEVQVGRMPDF